MLLYTLLTHIKLGNEQWSIKWVWWYTCALLLAYLHIPTNASTTVILPPIKITFYNVQLENSHDKISRIMASIIATLYNTPTMIFQQLGTASHILHKHVPPD